MPMIQMQENKFTPLATVESQPDSAALVASCSQLTGGTANEVLQNIGCFVIAEYS
jgi:hypothetical protein